MRRRRGGRQLGEGAQPAFPYMQWEVVSLEGRVEDTQRSCIPIDTEEGFLLHSCKDGRQRERKEVGGGGGGRASYFSDTESACECDACVDRVGRACS